MTSLPTLKLESPCKSGFSLPGAEQPALKLCCVAYSLRMELVIADHSCFTTEPVFQFAFDEYMETRIDE